MFDARPVEARRWSSVETLGENSWPLIRLLVVDDHRALVEAMAHRFAAEPDFDVIATATSADDALRALAGREPDVALLDLDLAGADGVALGRELRQRRPALRLVAVTCSQQLDRLTDAVHTGFLGWVPKASRFAVLADVVRAVVRGETRIPGELLTPLLHEFVTGREEQRRVHKRLAALTVREREVLQCMSDGLSREAIATKLMISPNTVRTHMQSILTKLRVHSSLAAVAACRSKPKPLA